MAQGLDDHISELRRFVTATRIQHQLIKHSGKWTQLCSCMDTIEDTEAAIRAFPAATVSKETGRRYLAVYGLLQALFVQQDAVTDLHEALGLAWSAKDIPELDAIRRARNASVGHPTKQGSTPNHHFIVQISMTADSFDLLSREANGKTTTSRVKLGEFMVTQRRVLGEALSRLLDTLAKQDEEHLMKFSGSPLSATFDAQIHYAFEKLVGSTQGWSPPQLGSWGLQHVEKGLGAFKGALEQRGLSVDAYPGIGIVWKEMEYPIRKLHAFFGEGEDEDAPDPEAAYIFASYLHGKVDELLHMAGEIDSEYQQDTDGKPRGMGEKMN